MTRYWIFLLNIKINSNIGFNSQIPSPKKNPFSNDFASSKFIISFKIPYINQPITGINNKINHQ